MDISHNFIYDLLYNKIVNSYKDSLSKVDVIKEVFLKSLDDLFDDKADFYLNGFRFIVDDTISNDEIALFRKNPTTGRYESKKIKLKGLSNLSPDHNSCS